jgi:nucleoside-diphosphate kinase
MEQTLVIIKPDAVQRGLVGELIARYERKGLKIVAARMMHLAEADARDLYSVHEGRDFYEPLVAFMISGPVLAMVLTGRGAIDVVRELHGPTFGPKAPPGTVRGDYAMGRRHNCVHGSDSPASAQREIACLFDPDEIIRYRLDPARWVYEDYQPDEETAS